MSVRHNQMFEKSVIVVAHLDDEILWFSSVLEKVDETIACFLAYPSAPSLEQGRRRVIAEYPLNISCLEIEEPGSFNTANWNTPVESPFGLDIAHNRAVKIRYEQNYHRLCARLASTLRGFRNVYTHNPWGEYGHEDHVQVYRAVKAVQTQLGFNLWFSNYCGNRSCALMLDHIARLNPEYITLPTNRALARDITDLYKKHNCWTWYDDHDWFKDECFLTDIDAVRNTRNHGHSFPINMLKTDFPESVDQRGWFECFITGLFSRGKTTN